MQDTYSEDGQHRCAIRIQVMPSLSSTRPKKKIQPGVSDTREGKCGRHQLVFKLVISLTRLLSNRQDFRGRGKGEGGPRGNA